MRVKIIANTYLKMVRVLIIWLLLNAQEVVVKPEDW